MGCLGLNLQKGSQGICWCRGERGPVSQLGYSPLSPSPQSNQEQSLQQKLLDEQFSILQETVREAEDILRDAVAKLDDPLHIRCTSSPGTYHCLTGSPFSLQDR